MTNPLNTPTSRAIVKAVRGSLRLVGSSSELLTASQLFAVRSDLHETLAIVNGQIQASQSGTSIWNVLERFATNSHFIDDQKLVIDLSDWEGSSDEGDEDNGDAPVGEYPTHLTLRWPPSHENDSRQAREGRFPYTGGPTSICRCGY